MKKILTDKFLEKNIDEGMRYAIKELNRKGYNTCYCCEGHYEESYGCYMGAYIYFTGPIKRELWPNLPTFPYRDDNIVWSKYRTPVAEAGNGYKNKMSLKKEERSFYWTGTRYKRMKREEKDAEHAQFLKELNEWVDSLPEKSA